MKELPGFEEESLETGEFLRRRALREKAFLLKEKRSKNSLSFDPKNFMDCTMENLLVFKRSFLFCHD